MIVDDEKMIRMGIKNTMPWEKIENVNIKCERFFDFFRFSIMHKRWSCFLVHYSHICYYIAASSFSNSSLLLQ